MAFIRINQDCKVDILTIHPMATVTVTTSLLYVERRTGTDENVNGQKEERKELRKRVSHRNSRPHLIT